jgi:glutamate/aspartate transport system permease protein
VKYNWNWGIFWQLSPDGHGTYLDTLLAGLGWTLATALAAWLIALALGMVVGVIRTTPVNWMRRVGDAWVEVFRNVPLLVQMFLWYFILPEVLPRALGDAMKQMPPPWGSFVPALLCLGLYTSARERYVPIQFWRVASEWRVSRSGSPLPQTYRYILLPMAIRIVAAAHVGIPERHQEQRRGLTIGRSALTASAARCRSSASRSSRRSRRPSHHLALNLVVVRGMRGLERRPRCRGPRCGRPCAAGYRGC